MLSLPLLRREVAATVRLAGPLIGAQLAHMGLAFIDTVMAGKLSAATLAAVAVGASVWASTQIFLIGVLLAVPPSVSQLDGEGEVEAIGPLVRQALWVGLGLAAAAILVVTHIRPLLELLRVEPEIVPTAQGYLNALTWGVPALAVYLLLRFTSEGVGATRPVLYFGLLGLPVNAAADWVLMYGKLGFPAMGAAGCGHATAAVWWVQCLGMVLYMVLHPRYRPLALFSRLERPRRRPIAEVLRVGVPIGVAIFIEGSLFGLAALLMASLGTETVAGHQVTINFAAFTFMVPLGLAMAITVRVGNAVGRKDAPGLLRATWTGIALAMGVQAIAAAVMITLPRAITRLYTANPEVTAVAVQLLFFAAILQISDGLQVAVAGALRGLKDTRVPMAITVVAYWLVGLPLGYQLAFVAGLGARGLWLGLVGGLTVAAALLVWRLRRTLGRTVRRLDLRT